MDRGDLISMAGAAAGLMAARAVARRIREESLRGEVAVVTGGSRGLGFALARELLRNGCRVVICARHDDELRRAARELSRLGETIAVPCDVGDPDDVRMLIDTAVEYFGRVDILVNNAGVIDVGPVDAMRLGDYRRMMDILYWGTVYGTLAVLPRMKERGHGRIVNITSIGGKISIPHLLPYGAAKFAAVGFSEGLQAETAKDGIAVTTIVPGLMRTGSFRQAWFHGDVRREYAWFSSASMAPLLSISVDRAARQIVRAIRRRSREVVLSAPAKLGVRAEALAPAAVIALLALFNRVLPRDASPLEVKGAEVEEQAL